MQVLTRFDAKYEATLLRAMDSMEDIAVNYDTVAKLDKNGFWYLPPLVTGEVYGEYAEDSLEAAKRIVQWARNL